MLANPDIVRNLHQVVDFDAASDASVIQRAAVNCGISSNFHIVSNSTAPICGNLRWWPSPKT